MCTKIALLLFKATILSYFDIGNLFYNSCSEADLQCLQTLKNKALRIIFTDHASMDLAVLHKRAGILKLQERRNINLIASSHSKNNSFQSIPKTNTRLLHSSTLMACPHQALCCALHLVPHTVLRLYLAQK